MFRLRYAALNMTVFYGGFHKMQNQDGANSEGVFRLRYAALNMTVFYGGFHKMQNQDGANSEGMFRLRYASLNMTVFYWGFHKMQNQDGANSEGMFRLRYASLNMTVNRGNKKAAPYETALSIFTFSFLTFIAAGGEELTGFGFTGNSFGGTIVTHRTTETDGIGT
jgi:hypothetical protein